MPGSSGRPRSPDTEQPEAEQPEAEQTGTELPETGLPETGLPETGLPDTELPDTELSGASPGTGPAASVVVRRRVEWADTDAAGHYHHSTVIRWVEYAETVLLDRLGVRSLLFGRTPRVHYEVDYTRTLWFAELVDVELTITEVGRTSLRYAFTVRQGDHIAARGTMIAVNCDPQVGRPEPWSVEVRARLCDAGPQRPELID